MLIQPQTNLLILKDVPLDNTYDHTIFFTGKGTQAQYFMQKMKYSRSDYTYQRVNSKQIRVDILADNLYDCNYIMFQNTAYGDKWFYAFIVSVEYVNDTVSLITYEIDVMQTWHFDYEPDDCFVLYEHSVTDNIGDNILPEAIEIGEYIVNGSYTQLIGNLGNLGTLVMITDNDDAVVGSTADGIYCGSSLCWFNSSQNKTAIDNLINEYAQKPEAIVNMYMIPDYLMQSVPNNVITHTVNTVKGFFADLGGAGTTVDGYTPRNKKLLTYPFNFFNVSNGDGASLSLRYEFFENGNPELYVTGSALPPVQMRVCPRKYKGSGDTAYNEESLCITGYPACSWSSDYYAAWSAQNSVPNFIRAVPAILLDTVKAATGTGTFANSINLISNLYATKYQASIHADVTHGNVSGNNANSANRMQSFYTCRMSISKDYAKVADAIFDRRGYATNKLKKPNRNSRPHWNFVQTAGATITGSVPCDDLRRICNIYDNGITFWKNGNEIGNYSLDNSPS